VGSRRQAREHALQILFQIDMTGDDPETVFEHHWHSVDVTPDTREFAERLVLGTFGNGPRIDEQIRSISENWRLERMATVDRNVIRLAIYEILHEKDTPAVVAINEAIEIAKRFGGEESAQFVNGVLDAVRRAMDSPANAS
jgi:N utilization substance protein B